MRHESFGKLLLGLGTGAAFGALLHKGGADTSDAIVAQLLGRDFRIAKLMGTAIAVGGLATHALVRAGKSKLEVKPLKLGSIVVGGTLFGAGLAAFGYCPGTGVAAAGAGRRDAIAGVLGMLAGAALFVRVFPRIKPVIEAGDRGKVTLPSATRTSPWPWLLTIGASVAAAAASDQVMS
jgi:uncharacterized protein